MNLAPIGLVGLLLAILALGQPRFAEAFQCQPAVTTSVTILEQAEGQPTALRVMVLADRALRPTNAVSRIGIASLVNARADVSGQALVAGVSVPVMPPRESWTFTMRRTGAGPFLVSFVASDACGDVPKFVGYGGGTLGAPSPLPGRLDGQPCPPDIHDAVVTPGPDGQLYPTWHPPVDPDTGCYFGHEHGADPRTSQANPELPPFGYIAATVGHEPEPHEGFKVFVVHNGTLFEGKRAPADIRAVFHMGTSKVGRYTNTHHSIVYDYVTRDGTGREAHVQGMADTGDAIGSTCDRPRQGGRDFSTIGCDDPYEIWNFRLQIIHPNDPFTDVEHSRATFDGAVASFDPVTTRDPADLTRLVYTEQYRSGPSAGDPLAPRARYRGCQREVYAGAHWNNPGGQTEYWTDGHGTVSLSGPGPGLLRQELSRSPKGGTVIYKYRQDFCDGTVRAPN